MGLIANLADGQMNEKKKKMLKEIDFGTIRVVHENKLEHFSLKSFLFLDHSKSGNIKAIR